MDYALIIAGVALISAAAVSVFGHKVTDMVASTAAVLPCTHGDDNGPITSGKLIETAGADAGSIDLDVTTIAGNSDTPRLGNNVLGTDPGADGGFGGLVVEVDSYRVPMHQSARGVSFSPPTKFLG